MMTKNSVATQQNAFVDSVKDSLEALLTDLQNTTAVLKKANLSSKYQRDSIENDPIYEPQKVNVTTMAAPQSGHGLQDLEQMLEDYSSQRGRRQDGRPTVESLFAELDNAVPNGDSRKYPSASSATKDLDNLMSSLSEFKVTSTSQTFESSNRGDAGVGHVNNEPPYARPVRSPRTTTTNVASHAAPTQLASSDMAQLDSILGNLSSDLSKHGITTIPKGDCAACQKSIIGQVVIALGRMWHPEHFTCSNCGEELGHRNFFERSNAAYCENDYHNLFSPRCAYCNGPIKDKCITALDKTWHPEHFFCASCGKEFGDDGFHEKEGRAYCRKDYFATFAPRCRGCQRAITNSYITALNSQWHPECFVCQDCKQPFAGGSFFDHDGQPFCETHYHEKRGSLCAGCHKPISGKCVTAMGKKFHPEHFVCSFCLQQLNKGTFKEHECKPYCHKCFNKLLQ